MAIVENAEVALLIASGVANILICRLLIMAISLMRQSLEVPPTDRKVEYKDTEN